MKLKRFEVAFSKRLYKTIEVNASSEMDALDRAESIPMKYWEDCEDADEWEQNDIQLLEEEGVV
jgi:hypothetical protein